jgi:hypothetical protein
MPQWSHFSDLDFFNHGECFFEGKSNYSLLLALLWVSNFEPNQYSKTGNLIAV